MKPEYELHDRVLITKPKQVYTEGIPWIPHMDKFDGIILDIVGLNYWNRVDLYELSDEIGYSYHESWLTKIEKEESENENQIKHNMETKFKIGDEVLVTKPKDRITGGLYWSHEMDKFNGKTFMIKEVDSDDEACFRLTNRISTGDLGFWFHESWLTKIEMNPNKQILEQPTEQEPQQCCSQCGFRIRESTEKEESSNIDWEKRRWDLMCSLIIKGVHIEIAMGIVDTAIEKFK